MGRGLIILQSGNLDMYANVITAACNTYREVSRIELVISEQNSDIDYVLEIRKRLETEDNPKFKLASNRHIEIFQDNWNSSSLQDVKFIDVTGASKSKLLELIADLSQLRNPKPLTTLNWLTKNPSYDIMTDEWEYVNLLEEDIVRGFLSGVYWKGISLIAILSLLAIMVIVAAASIFGAGIIPEKMTNIISLLIGFCGVILSYASLKK